MNHPYVEVQNLSFAYTPPRKRAAGRQALRKVSFAVSSGEIFGLLGPNGGGKTTLLRILSTILLPREGLVRISGIDILERPGRIRQLLGVGFQSPSLDGKLTVEENLRHHGHLYGLHGPPLKRRMGELLEFVGLSDRTRDLVETLSGGTARRVELAKALLHDPALLLLDEPGAGLDPGARRDLWARLNRLRAEKRVTILLTSHIMEEAAACDRLALLHQGRVVALGSPRELTAQIGGDVITIRAEEPRLLSRLIEERFGCPATLLEGNIRIEREGGHQFIPQLAEAFPGQILAISVGRPTLEDVFIHRTGHRLRNAGGVGS